jgi:hypothetical protein
MRLQSLIFAGAVFASGCVPVVSRKTPGVTGRVLDSRSGKAVAGARVGFSDFKALTKVTGQDGRFSFAPTHKFEILVFLAPIDRFPEGVRLEVRKFGYRGLDTRVLADRNESLDLRIDPSK